MTGNERNARTTFPRVKARRQRAADRFYVARDRLNEVGYMARKSQEAEALGLIVSQCIR
jgi:hypothetical protein